MDTFNHMLFRQYCAGSLLQIVAIQKHLNVLLSFQVVVTVEERRTDNVADLKTDIYAW